MTAHASNDLQTLVTRARDASRSGSPYVARESWLAVLHVDTENVVAHRALARIHTKEGQVGEAIDHWLQVRRLRPDIGETPLRLARLYRDNGMIVESISAYEAMQEADPENVECARVLPGLRARLKERPAPKGESDDVPLLARIPETVPNETSVARYVTILGECDEDLESIALLLESLGEARRSNSEPGDVRSPRGGVTLIEYRARDLSDAATAPTPPTDVLIVFDDPVDGEPRRSSSTAEFAQYLDATTTESGGDIVYVYLPVFRSNPRLHTERLCNVLGIPFDPVVLNAIPSGPVRDVRECIPPRSRIRDGDELSRHMIDRFKRDFGIADSRTTENIERMLDTLSGSQVLVASKRSTLLTASLDAERSLGIRLKTLDRSRSRKRQADLTRQLLSDIDFEAYRRMQALYTKEESIRFHWDFVKYLNLDYWFDAKYRIASKLGLDRSSGLRVLDLGVGPGHFPLACRYLGHEVVGTDIDCSDTGSWGQPHLYDALTGFFELDRRTHQVEPMRLVDDFGPRFDLVTAFMVKFNVIIDGDDISIWGVREWDFFLRDIAANQLNSDGRIFMKMNMTGQDTSHRYVNDELLEYFTSHGAVIDLKDSTVDFRDLESLLRSDTPVELSSRG